jgi:hypothetical protein
VPAVEVMRKTVLTLKERPHVPLEAEVLTPDVIAPLGHNELGALPVVLGKRQHRLDDFFEVEGPASEELEDDEDEGETYADWNVPSCQELIASLYRPDR